VWDARLTSVLVLFFLYLGYIALVNAFDDASRGGRAGSLLALVGVVNLPIIKFSVDWWNTLHQPASVFRFGGPTIDLSMLVPLLVMALGFTLLFGWLLLLRMRTALNERRLRALRIYGQAATAGAAGEPASAAARPAWRCCRCAHSRHISRWAAMPVSCGPLTGSPRPCWAGSRSTPGGITAPAVTLWPRRNDRAIRGNDPQTTAPLDGPGGSSCARRGDGARARRL
jgi:hypothetical protein